MKTFTALRMASVFLIACSAMPPTTNEVHMKPLTVINRLVLKPGKLEEFIEAQRVFAATMMRTGLISSRMYRGVDGTTAILVSQFASKAAQEEVSKQPAFVNHLRTLQPLVESSSPTACEEAYTWGKPE
jgi:quinol monooxygenase YgiN